MCAAIRCPFDQFVAVVALIAFRSLFVVAAACLHCSKLAEGEDDDGDGDDVCGKLLTTDVLLTLCFCEFGST